MSTTQGGPGNIVTNGLVLYLDAANPTSYPYTGSTWFDLSGQANNGTLVNGSIYSSLNAGIIDFDGVDDYLTLGSSATSLIQGKTSFSIGIMFKLDSLANLRGLIGTLNYSCTRNLGLTSSNGGLEFYNDTSSCYSVSIPNFVEVGKWVYAVGTYNGTTTRLYGIKDGVLTQTSGTTKSGPTNTFTSDFRVMGNQFSSFFTNGQCSQSFVYNKALSQQEITQNYNSIRARFGI
jgi:hypothetical protein